MNDTIAETSTSEPKVVEEPTNEVSVRVYKIPSPNLPQFVTRLEKLVKRATKLHVPTPSYTVLKEEPKVIQVRLGVEEDEFGRERAIMEERVILISHIVLNHPTVKVDGYTFLGTLEHTEEGNLLHCVPGYSIPAQYRSCNPWCDHCKLSRRRADTYIVREDATNTYKQVGRNCLGDFLGRSAEMWAAMAELYSSVGECAEACENEGEGGWGSGGERYELLDSYLSFVAECIAHKGWLSRTSAQENGGTATADLALRHLHPSPYTKDKDLLFRTPTEQSVQVAKDAIAWCEEMSDGEVEGNDYLYNIRLIARRGVCTGRQMGYAASIVSSYQRHIGTLKAKERQATHPSQYVGEVGKRMTFTGIVVERVISWDTAYGRTHLHVMCDKEGNRLTWKASVGPLETGKEYVLKGTVKAHEEYKGTKQTQLSRCKVQE